MSTRAPGSDVEHGAMVLDSGDPGFDLACHTIASQQARLVLAEVVNGKETSYEISSALSVSQQLADYYLDKLERAGFVQRRGFVSRPRGRKATRYAPRKVYLVAIPSEVVKEKKGVLKVIRRKAREAFLARLAPSILAGTVASALTYMAMPRASSPGTGTVLELISGQTLAIGLALAVGAVTFLTVWVTSRLLGSKQSFS